MPKYMFGVTLSHDGLAGTLKEGGAARKRAAKKLVESLGGKLEAFYYAFGDPDVVVIADLPDNKAAAALATTVAAAGVGSIRTTVLMMPEEIDEVGKQTPTYRPPGG